MKTKNEICANCGRTEKEHDEIALTYRKTGCKKFTPKTGKYGDKGRAKNHSSTEAEKLDEMPDYETTSQDTPSDNLCMQVSEGIHSQENPNGIGKRGNAFSPDTQNQKGCGEQISDGSFEKVYCGKQRKIHLCSICQEEKQK